MKKTMFRLLNLAVLFLIPLGLFAQQNEYTQRFLDLRAKINDPANGYFSADGVPYHSVEKLICEAPDYGHETTSEAYSYWIWLEAMYGGISGDWAPLNSAWTKMETFAIPSASQQPTTSSYNPSDPADFAGEHALPSGYPSILESGVPVGADPVSPDLTSAYGSNIYGMHWLFDCDNFYGYGNMGDGVSTPSYINTFQRGEQESVWETVPHPSWESFKWGKDGGTGGFLQLFVDEAAPAKQWRYTNAPDADARAVQAMYWAVQFAKEQGKNPTSTLPLAKAAKMGDFGRLAMCDKYFKPIGSQSKSGPGGTGYSSVHYLISWYYAWGGPLESQGWAWRIGSSHNHFGYQNPVSAYALSSTTELRPTSTNGVRDWTTSLGRQLEFYTWLQSSEGAIAGGATNSWNGVYDAYPSGTPTFYNMAYQEHPVYHDPGSNQWFGMQAWSMERVAEFYYITNNAMAKALMDKWVNWVKPNVHLIGTDDFEIPSTLVWSGKPNTWNPASPVANTGLHVTISEFGKDLGVAGCLAKALVYYAAATQKYGTLDAEARDLAKAILDRMWNKYYEPTGKGVAVIETRGDFDRFFDQEVYIPSGWTGKMANGDVIKPGVKFIDIRSQYRSDPDFPALEAAYNSGTDYSAKYHRFWAQVDIALANAEYGRFFGGPVVNVPVTGVSVAPPTATITTIGGTTALTATIAPSNATNKSVTWSTSSASIATVNSSGVVTAVAAGNATITVTTVDGSFTATSAITVTPTTTIPVTGVTVSPLSATITTLGGTTALTATVTPGNATNKSVTWGSNNTAVATVNSSGVVTAVSEGLATITVTTVNGGFTATSAITVDVATDPSPCDNPVTATLPIIQNGTGEYCWVTSGTISYVNSWNMALVEINGVDFTNKWSNNMPARIDGNYYIHYKSTVGWSHLEVNGTGGGTNTPVTGVSISPTTATITTIGGTTALTATVTPGNATNKSVTWSTSSASIATVNSSGVVTAVSAGSATITVTTVDGSFTATSAITVNPTTTIPVTGVSVSPTTATITTLGGTTALTATVAPSNATNKSVSWSSNNTAVATVNNSGVVTAVSEGLATITVTTVNGGFTATSAITVDVATDPSPCDNPVAISIPFTKDGTGESCYVTSQGIAYVNSWNMSLVEINGVDFTNKWSNNLPAAIDGKWYITYKATVAWAHFEAPAAKSAEELSDASVEAIVYPNPFNESVNIQLNNYNDVQRIVVMDQVGRVVYIMNQSEIIPSVEIGENLNPGLYYLNIYGSGLTKSFVIIKQ